MKIEYYCIWMKTIEFSDQLTKRFSPLILTVLPKPFKANANLSLKIEEEPYIAGNKSSLKILTTPSKIPL